MECLQVSPCMGWMSADPERRARTTKREQELSQAAEELVNEQKGLTPICDILGMSHGSLDWRTPLWKTQSGPNQLFDQKWTTWGDKGPNFE